MKRKKDLTIVLTTAFITSVIMSLVDYIHYSWPVKNNELIINACYEKLFKDAEKTCKKFKTKGLGCLIEIKNEQIQQCVKNLK